MAIVKKKSKARAIKVQTVRQPSSISEMGDVNFGNLGAASDGKMVSYDAVTQKFVLITADELLSVAAEDNDISDDLVTALEGELNLGEVLVELDGGTF